VPNPSLPPQADDLSALAWVQSELRRSLENAHKALRRFLKESEAIGKSDVDAPDPGVLRSARAQIHQGLGALELVGLPVPARMLRAEEAAVQKLLVRPAALDEAAVQVIERASFALLDYIGRVLAGKPLSPVAMYPQYRDVQVLAGADRVHPADLWDHDWRWLELPPEAGIEGVPADDAAREVMESLVLEVMRRLPDAAAGPF
jgi:chemosensory pili system protein ChpA (sensor histidine kinase/response regulator)